MPMTLPFLGTLFLFGVFAKNSWSCNFRLLQHNRHRALFRKDLSLLRAKRTWLTRLEWSNVQAWTASDASWRRRRLVNFGNLDRHPFSLNKEQQPAHISAVQDKFGDDVEIFTGSVVWARKV
jgi:hypothetical protein